MIDEPELFNSEEKTVTPHNECSELKTFQEITLPVESSDTQRLFVHYSPVKAPSTHQETFLHLVVHFPAESQEKPESDPDTNRLRMLSRTLKT